MIKDLKSLTNLKDFGIVEGTEYNITFERLDRNSDCKCGIIKTIRGVIMNYDTWQFSIKAKDGHYIILRKNILEMFPIHERIVTINNDIIVKEEIITSLVNREFEVTKRRTPSSIY